MRLTSKRACRIYPEPGKLLFGVICSLLSGILQSLQPSLFWAWFTFFIETLGLNQNVNPFFPGSAWEVFSGNSILELNTSLPCQHFKHMSPVTQG